MKMTVFVGWSGSGGKEIAARVRKFLNEFFKDRIVAKFSEQISAGDVWHTGLMKMLQKADYGLLCLTPKSEPSWLLYEAGILSQTTLFNLDDNPGPHIVPILFNVDSDILSKFGPLTHYQACSFQLDAIWELLRNINNASHDMTEARNASSQTFPRYLTPDEFEASWEKYRCAFKRDVCRLMCANDLELHLEPFALDMPFIGNTAGTGIPALFKLGQTLVGILRMDTATPDIWRKSFEKFRDTFEYVVSEEGLTPELAPIKKAIEELDKLFQS